MKNILKRVGVKIGHYTDINNATGVTIFIMEKGAYIGIDVRGSSVGTFNTESYGNTTSARKLIHGIVFTGGSIFGLESCFGVLEYLNKRRVGGSFGNKIIPGVIGAVIYDLSLGKEEKPGKKEGYMSCTNASYSEFNQGTVGVGTGATVGKWIKGKLMKGGFGISEITISKDIVMCAFVVTNSMGDLVNPITGSFYADEGGYSLNFPNNVIKPKIIHSDHSLNKSHTTLAVLATNVVLDRPILTKIAQMAHDGMARSIFPVHTSLDGDITFAISSRSGEKRTISTSDSYMIDLLGIAASEALMKAAKESIVNAKGLFDVPSYCELYKR